MSPERLALDTASEVEERQIDGWRRMTGAERLLLALRLSANVRGLALAGVRSRYPNASARVHQLRLAQVLLGDELARAAYPEIEAFDRP